MSPGIGIKMYPAGYFMHQTYEAALQLVLEHDVQPEDVREVEIGLRNERNFNRPIIRSRAVPTSMRCLSPSSTSLPGHARASTPPAPTTLT
jgi:hypothetical protein